MAILMFVEGVLRSSQGSPIPQGVALYRTLKDKGQVFLLCANKARDDRWLKENKINLVDDLIGTDIPHMTEWPEWRQVEYCRGQGQVDMVVTSDPALVQKLLEVGMTSLMFLQPTYITEKFRPDSREGRKSWGEITKEITRQQELYVEDHRVQ